MIILFKCFFGTGMLLAQNHEGGEFRVRVFLDETNFKN